VAYETATLKNQANFAARVFLLRSGTVKNSKSLNGFGSDVGNVSLELGMVRLCKDQATGRF
jgi:hypothetical protein